MPQDKNTHPISSQTVSNQKQELRNDPKPVSGGRERRDDIKNGDIKKKK